MKNFRDKANEIADINNETVRILGDNILDTLESDSLLATKVLLIKELSTFSKLITSEESPATNNSILNALNNIAIICISSAIWMENSIENEVRQIGKAHKTVKGFKECLN